MRAAACLVSLWAGVAFGAAAQQFVNLDFDVPILPPDIGPNAMLPWSLAAPGWGHGVGDSSGHLTYGGPHLGFSSTYALLPAALSPLGPDTGKYAIGMRSGSFSEDPQSPWTPAFVSQTGQVPVVARTLSLLASHGQFSVSLNGQAVGMRAVGLDPQSPTYVTDFLTYSGEWTADISAFAGQVAELIITETSNREQAMLAVDEIRFLPVPEPSTTVLMAVGAVGLLVALRRRLAPRCGRGART